jgi:hypothetical protein
VAGATRAENGFWRLPEELFTEEPNPDPRLSYLANRLQRSNRILFLFPPDPYTPVWVSLRARRAIIVDTDLLALEAGEVRRALLNANHIRFEYLFLPLPYPDGYFHYLVIGQDDRVPPEERQRVLAANGEIIRIER